MLERFLREAQSAAAVRGSHVVQIFDCGVDGRDPYIAMELLLGETLEERLTARGRLSPAELNEIFSQVATAVSNAHNLGVIHRDLKPANIFLAREGELEVSKVLDFGIAKVMNRTLQAAGTGTRTGTLLGTPSYMSPEQARGSRSLDQSTDLWSLAIIAFECLTGQQPFIGKALGELVVQICTELPRTPSSVADVPDGFDEWFLKGAAKGPADRFGSAREMAEALREILARPAPATQGPSDSPEAPADSPTLHSVAPLPTRVFCPPSLSPAQLTTPPVAEPRASLFRSSLRSVSEGLHSLRSAAPLAGLGRLAPWAAWLALLAVVSIALWPGAASRERARASQEPSPVPLASVVAAAPPQRGSELPAPELEVEPGAGGRGGDLALPTPLAGDVSAPAVQLGVQPAATPAAAAPAPHRAGTAAPLVRVRAVPASTAQGRPKIEAAAAPSPPKPSRAPVTKAHTEDPFADRL
jgi:serine/threonine-protein kinase